MTNEELLKKIEEAKASGATQLALSSKGLTALPPELFQLTNLTLLDLSGNQLASLPPEIGQLTNLTVLHLWENKLSSLPPEICQLKNLTELWLYNNQLSSLPAEIGQLTNLRELSLWMNQLNSLPSALFHLKNLRWLDLSRNQLSSLPPEICQLKNLQALIFWGNNLATLPQEICQLKNCRVFFPQGNPLICPPVELAMQGIKAIREYFAELEKGQQVLNEVKILLIGDGAAGKTSLVKRLRGEAFDEREDTTHGISIRGWEPECAGKQIRVNIWDVGGQEIQHATHQFFLSQRSLYVVVLDGRKDEQAEYWLRYIEAFGGDSPVLMVLNKIDNNPSFEVNQAFLREKYPGIRNFFRISCKTGKGVAEFATALRTELAEMNMVSIIWPKSWFAVKRRLELMEQPYISTNEYKSYCAEAGIAGKESQEVLADFLHDLGVAVHFKDFILDAMSVLNPVWVTNAVYTIITSEQMADSKGFLDLKHLGQLLPQGDEEKLCCPQETHPYIMRLMQNFELCYELSKDAVLIPQLLPVPEPQLAFNKEDALRFALHYPDFLPPPVFPRFMVKAHKDIHENTCWRTGVLLEDKRSGSQALVKADAEARRINIWVQGEKPREYLHYLRYILADINSSFEKLAVMELVPMPDNPDVTAEYENLLDLAEAGSDIFIPVGTKKKYSVHELLGLVQPKDKAELERVAEKASPQDTTTWVEMLTELVEPEWTIPVVGIKLNLKGFFEKLLARQKQKRQQAK